MKNKDQRTSIMSEILNNIRSIKLWVFTATSLHRQPADRSPPRNSYAWENSFAQKLFDVRNNKELVMLRKMGYLSSSSNFLWSFTPFVRRVSHYFPPSALTPPLHAGRRLLVVRPLLDHLWQASHLRDCLPRHHPLPTPQLPPRGMFPGLANAERSLIAFRLQVLPVVFSSLVEAYVSIDRLTDFLCGKELQSGAINIELPQRETVQGDELISVVHGEFSWNTKANAEATLVDINLSLKKGELLAVVGRVGAGKSSLLSAVLGEMTKTEGRVTVRGTVAYCSQQPWIMGACFTGRRCVSFQLTSRSAQAELFAPTSLSAMYSTRSFTTSSSRPALFARISPFFPTATLPRSARRASVL